MEPAEGPPLVAVLGQEAMAIVTWSSSVPVWQEGPAGICWALWGAPALLSGRGHQGSPNTAGPELPTSRSLGTTSGDRAGFR